MPAHALVANFTPAPGVVALRTLARYAGALMSEVDEPAGSRSPAAQMREVYAEARRIAHAVLQRAGAQTWTTTILTNEAFVRLFASGWAARAQAEPNTIIPVLRRVMKNALIDQYRRRSSDKRPGGSNRTTVYYEDGMMAFDDDPASLLDILDVVEQLRAGDDAQVVVADRKKFAEVLELGFILGCSAREIARQLEVPQTTVSRWLRYGKAVINRALQRGIDEPT
jgi:DNA-directed RNA polymerase specialized sigma24 family protein